MFTLRLQYDKKAKMMTPLLTVHKQRARRLPFKRFNSYYTVNVNFLVLMDVQNCKKFPSLITQGTSKRSFQHLHTTNKSFNVQHCMLRQDNILRDKTGGLCCHVELIWNNLFWGQLVSDAIQRGNLSFTVKESQLEGLTLRVERGYVMHLLTIHSDSFHS